MRVSAFIALLTVALIGFGYAGAAPPPDRILLDLTMTRDAKPTVSARLAVIPGQDAEITVTSTSEAADAFRIHATATPSAHPQGRSGAMVRVSLQVYERAGSEWILRGEPWFFSPLHGEGTVPAGAEDLSTASFGKGSGSASFEMTVFASALSEQGLGAIRKQCAPSPAAATQTRAPVVPNRPPDGGGGGGGSSCCADCGDGIFVCCKGNGVCCGAGSCGCCT